MGWEDVLDGRRGSVHSVFEERWPRHLLLPLSNESVEQPLRAAAGQAEGYVASTVGAIADPRAAQTQCIWGGPAMASRSSR